MAPLGVRLPNEINGYASFDRLTELAELADDLDYHSVWVPEEAARNGFMVLSHLATETRRVRLGTGIANVYSRSPALLAMSVATLEELSGGRSLLGVGASSRLTIRDWHGIDFDRPLRRIRETIEIVDRALADERVQYDGEVFDVDYRRQFAGAHQVPIFNAALGRQNRRLTGRLADGWLPFHAPLAAMETFVDEVRAAAVDAGRDPDAVTVAPYILSCVGEDADRARETVRRVLAFYVGAMEYYADVFRDYGFESAVRAVSDAWTRDREAAYEAVSDELLDTVAIAGSPEWGRERLADYRARGVDVPVLALPTGASDEQLRFTLSELSSA